MQKDINSVYVELTAGQKAKISPETLVHATRNNRDVLMIQDLKSIGSQLIGENLKYVDIQANQFDIIPVAAGLPNDPNLSKIYHVVPTQFVTNYQGFQDAANQLHARQTLDGRWVCALNTINEFWDLFGGQTIQLVQLSVSDFPGRATP